MTVTMQWRVSPSDRRVLYSPVGFRLIDDLTGRAPLGEVTCTVWLRDVAGQYWPTDLQPARNVSGALVFPGLGRSSRVNDPPHHYRAVITATYYRPFYAAQQDGLEFDAPPYNDAQPPPTVVGVPQDVVLVPAANYPFQPQVRVLRGDVRDAAGSPVTNVEISRGNTERVLSDESGCFALPLRQDPSGTPITIDALDHRSGKQGQAQVTLPADLGKSQRITIN